MELIQLSVEFLGLALLQSVQILVGVEGTFVQLDHGDGHVGAVIGDTLQVGQQIVEDKAGADGTGALLQALHVMQLHLVAEIVDDLLQRLDLLGAFQILSHKGIRGQMDDLGHCVIDDMQLLLRFGGEFHALLDALLSILRNVAGMVRDTLEIGEHMEELGNLAALLGGHVLTGQLREIGTEDVLVLVALGFHILHEIEAVLIEIPKQAQCSVDGLLRQLGHGIDGHAALLDSQGGVSKETFLQLKLGCFLGAPVGHQEANTGLDDIREGNQDQRHSQSEHRVYGGDEHRGHGHGHETEVHDGVGNVEDGCTGGDTHDGCGEINHSGPLTVQVCAQSGEQHGSGCADGDAQQHGKCHIQGHSTGHGQSLQNTDGCGCGLQYHGDQSSRENAQCGVTHGGDQVDECRIVAQGADGAAHGAEAQHQGCEAQHNVTHINAVLLLAEHPQDDAHHSHNTREGGSGQDGGNSLGAFNVAQTHHPAGDAGAQK